MRQCVSLLHRLFIATYRLLIRCCAFVGTVACLETQYFITKKAVRDHRKADVCTGMAVQPVDELFLDDNDDEDRDDSDS